MSTALLLLSLSIAAYFAVGFNARSKSKGSADYMVAGGTVGQNDYANTSVGYALQMAAIFLFATWGVMYGVGALWAAFFWGLGYFLLYLLLPRFLPFHDTAEPLTLHQYLRETYRAKKSLQLLAAFATVVGLLGTMFAEVDYVVQVMQPMSVSPLFAHPIGTQAILIAAGLAYVVWNGYKAEIAVERVQVPIAYCAILATILFLLPPLYKTASVHTFTLVAVVFLASLFMMAAAKVDWAGNTNRFTDGQIWIPLIGVAATCLVLWLIVSTSAHGSAVTALDAPVAVQFKAQGILGVASLFLANALWMPVDLATWQRVASVDKSDTLRILQRGTLRVAVESPAGWMLGAVLGWCIAGIGLVAATDDPSTTIPKLSTFLYELGADPIHLPGGSYVYAIFLTGSVAVMTSTISGILSAVGFTINNDILERREDASLGGFRMTTAMALILGFVSFEGLRSMLGANLGTLLYAAYAAQLSLIVIVIIALFKRRLHARAAFGSLAVGLLATFAYVTYAIQKTDPRAFVMPPFFAIIGAVVGYALFYRAEGELHVKANRTSVREKV